jgi:hypothetical protein
MYNYLPIFRRRREEPKPSAETMQMARLATADTLAAALRLHAISPQQGRALIAERAVEGLLLRGSYARLLPYPATDREDMGSGIGRIDTRLKPCLHDSYVIIDGNKKVPIQTKFAGQFQETPGENNYYNDLVAKVSYRETSTAALSRMRGWDNRTIEQFGLVLANRLVADLRGEHVSKRMHGALRRATDHVWNIVRGAAAK